MFVIYVLLQLSSKLPWLTSLYLSCYVWCLGCKTLMALSDISCADVRHVVLWNYSLSHTGICRG